MSTLNIRRPAKRTLSSIPVEHAHGGSGSRQLIFSKADPFVSTQFEAMTKGFLDKEGIFDWHDHKDVDEFFLVTAGQGKIEYEDGTTFDYKPGDIIYNPANLKHRITNTTEDMNEFFFVRIHS